MLEKSRLWRPLILCAGVCSYIQSFLPPRATILTDPCLDLHCSELLELVGSDGSNLSAAESSERVVDVVGEVAACMDRGFV